jgi:esterase
LCDNARTLFGELNDQRQPFTPAQAESIRVPSLFIGGADSTGPLPIVPRALAAHVPGTRVAFIPGASHVMFIDDADCFREVVLDFPGED